MLLKGPTPAPPNFNVAGVVFRGGASFFIKKRPNPQKTKCSKINLEIGGAGGRQLGVSRIILAWAFFMKTPVFKILRYPGEEGSARFQSLR